MFGSSHCQPLNIINLWRAVSVINLLYNSSINIEVTANKNMFNNNVQTLSFRTLWPLSSSGQSLVGQPLPEVVVLGLQNFAWAKILEFYYAIFGGTNTPKMNYVQNDQNYHNV